MGKPSTIGGAVAAVALSAALAAPADADTGTDDPWGPYGWDAQADRFHQPQLATPVPDPKPLGRFDTADFDDDGVVNRHDNCLLVPNAGQQPAVRPTTLAERRRHRAELGPADLLRLSRQWKAEHPDARFLDDAELGQACSGYNDNYLRTLRALTRAGNVRKLEIFEYLGQSGPMFGGAAVPFPKGKPTSYDTFGTIPGATAPSPVPDDALPQNADGSLATGALAPSLPMCSGWDQMEGFVRWLTMTERLPADLLLGPLRAQWEAAEDRIGCSSDGGVAAESQLMRHFWAGKRLYTNAEGGRITNRFFASITESPVFASVITQEPLRTLAKRSGFIPYIDDPTATGQSRHGIIFRGRSYLDGNDAILMDWRGFQAAWPLGPGRLIGNAAGMLIYDECRAVQTGVYHCTAVTDWKVLSRRHTFQEGYMPWVLKGPPSIEEYRQAVR